MAINIFKLLDFLCRPSTIKLHHFVPEKERNKVTHHMLHVTLDMCYMTRDRWGELTLLSKFLLLSSYGLGVKVFWKYFHKGSLTEWLPYQLEGDKGVLEQPRLKHMCLWTVCFTQVHWQLYSIIRHQSGPSYNFSLFSASIRVAGTKVLARLNSFFLVCILFNI